MTGWEYKKGTCHFCTKSCDMSEYFHQECFESYFK